MDMGSEGPLSPPVPPILSPKQPQEKEGRWLSPTETTHMSQESCSSVQKAVHRKTLSQFVPDSTRIAAGFSLLPAWRIISCG